MNNLSWLLYIADIVGNLSILLGVAIFVSIALGLGLIVLSVPMMDLGASENAWRAYWKAWKYVIFIGLPCTLTFSILPERQTIYLIALSEGGEEVLKMPEFQKVRQYVNKWLDSQIEDGIEDKKEESE